MKQEYEDLLLKDLCARLPYGIICKYRAKDYAKDCGDFINEDEGKIESISFTNSEVVIGFTCVDLDTDIIKPYLRPTSSMTKEEYKEMQMVLGRGEFAVLMNKTNGLELWLESVDTDPTIWFDSLADVQDWLNKKMFAYRTIYGYDMFELGLALEAPEGMYE